MREKFERTLEELQVDLADAARRAAEVWRDDVHDDFHDNVIVTALDGFRSVSAEFEGVQTAIRRLEQAAFTR